MFFYTQNDGYFTLNSQLPFITIYHAGFGLISDLPPYSAGAVSHFEVRRLQVCIVKATQGVEKPRPLQGV